MSDTSPPAHASTDPVTPEVLTITIEHTRPIELGVLMESLVSLASQHARYAEHVGASINGDQVKLYVREIRSGSIIVDLIALSQGLGTITEPINTIVGFAKSLTGIYDFFRGRRDTLPKEATPKDVLDASAFLKATSGDVNGNVTVVARNHAQVVVYPITSEVANAIQNRAANYAALAAQPVSGRHFQQLFYFAQASGNPKADTGDRGIIEGLSSRPVKTIFADADIKKAMLTEALFLKAYIVDVDVQTIDGRPRLYRILHVHESFDRIEP